MNTESFPKNIKRMFVLAKQASVMSDFKNYKIGAVIFEGKKPIIVEHNCCKGLPMQKEYNHHRGFEDDNCKHFGHAEMRALDKLIKHYHSINFNKISICIYREHKNGKCALSKPCPACEAALKALGIKNIYYTGEDSLLHEYYL